MTKELKFMIRKRQNAFIKYGKKWRNKVQQKIKTAKAVYYEHKIANLDQCNSSKWWKKLKSLTGQDIKQEWYHQFLEDNVDVILSAIIQQLRSVEGSAFSWDVDRINDMSRKKN
jgi:hypothetical protein